jgi:Transposase DDE domain group 1
MRLTVSSLSRVYNRDLRIEFGAERLTSYGGLELLSRFFRSIQLRRRVRERLRAAGMNSGDYGGAHLVLLVIGLFVVGARRMEHLRFLATDTLFRRFCCLSRIPSERTVVNWLKGFGRHSLQALIGLNEELVCDDIEELGLRRLTIDLDGTVIRTGQKVAWAVRGYNPHHPKSPSYYPLLAHLAETGQILRLKNRPGNVIDRTGAPRFLLDLVSALRARFGRSVALDFRLDAAFFKDDLIRLLPHLGCHFALKVPFWNWLGLKNLVAANKVWTPIHPGIEAFEAVLPISQWDLELRVVVYRKRVHHQTAKNFQLDLFSPDDGTFEYQAVTTNKLLGARALWDFMAGRGAQEKIFGELKGEFALDVVPTNHYGANSAWMQLSILAHNLIRSFQIHGGIADLRPVTPKHTFLFRLLSMKTLRFELVARAARLARVSGRQVLRFADNTATKTLYDRVAFALAA